MGCYLVGIVGRKMNYWHRPKESGHINGKTRFRLHNVQGDGSFPHEED
jgi:hypothetical protein